MNSVTVSIVSHDQDVMVAKLLDQIAKHATCIAKVIVTYNINSDKVNAIKQYPFELIRLNNQQPQGFGANHNQASKYCETSRFCVMNPDIHLTSDPFRELLACLEDTSISVVAPLVVNVNGEREDNARFFPTPLALIRKFFSSVDGVFPITDSASKVVFPDWLGGMFLLFSTEKYKELSGFDEKYFLYYEDVDFCARSWRYGYKTALCTCVKVIHDARRTSHKNLKYLKWHAASAFRFFLKHLGRFPERNI